MDNEQTLQVPDQMPDPDLHVLLYPHVQAMVESLQKVYPEGYAYPDDMLDQIADDIVAQSGLFTDEEDVDDDPDAIPTVTMRGGRGGFRQGRRGAFRGGRGFARNLAKGLLIGSLFGGFTPYYPYPMNYPYPYCNYHYCPGFPPFY